MWKLRLEKYKFCSKFLEQKSSNKCLDQVSWAVSNMYINSLSPSSDTGMQYTQNYNQLDS